MKIKYLGTGAAERIPGIFCKCKLCQNARKKGGKEIRTQSQFIIDDQLLIDFPGDSYLHMLRDDLDFSQFSYLLLSHWHSDHFYGEDLAYRMRDYADGVDNLLTVYGNKDVKKFYDRAFQLESRQDADRLCYHEIKAYQKFTIENYVIHSLPAKHGWFQEDCFIFAIDDGQKVFLSTHDSGYFSLEMFDYLSQQNLVFAVVSLDCTHQLKPCSENHMNWQDNLLFIEELKKRKLVTAHTVFVANHFSHNGGLTYEEMASITKQKGVITSYDGMVVEV